MKRGWVLVLLISLGLNLGLGIKLLEDRGRPGGSRSHREFRGSRTRWTEQDSLTRDRMITRRLDRIAGEVGLSPEQREAFGEVHRETGRMLMRKRVLIGEKRRLLHSLVAEESIDGEGIRAAIAELGQEQAVLDSLVAETMLQEMEILEPGQRARYLEMLSLDRGEGGPGHGRQGRRRHRQ